MRSMIMSVDMSVVGGDLESTVVHHSGRISQKPILFFDVDDCLYPQNTGVYEAASELINDYFENHLGFCKEDTVRLRAEYLRDYGLIVEGLICNHKVDPKEFNRMVDDALPLDRLIRPDPKLQQLFEDIDRSKVRLWLFSNAHITHVRRVTTLLGIDGFFEGATYCDYAVVPLICKPQTKMFEEAMRAAGIDRTADCYFVDDSYRNCQGAQQFGWTAVHLVEDGLPTPVSQASQYQIRDLEELRTLFPQFFKR